MQIKCYDRPSLIQLLICYAPCSLVLSNSWKVLIDCILQHAFGSHVFRVLTWDFQISYSTYVQQETYEKEKADSIEQLINMLKTGFRGCSDFGFRILRDLASTYVLHRPCSLSLYFRISQSSGWSDLVVSEECNLSWFQNWRIAYMNEGLMY